MTRDRDGDKADWTEQSGKALAAGLGAVAGLPFGPAGLVGGAIAGPLLEPVAVEILHRAGEAGKRRSGEMLTAAFEAAGLSAEKIFTRISDDENLQLLAGVAIVAAARTAWADKVRVLGRSLASGLLASDEAEVSTENLMLAAIADIEAPHLSLLDLLVTSLPPRTEKRNGQENFSIPEYWPKDGSWMRLKWRSWTVEEISESRPRLSPVLPVLLGTLQRNGLVFFEPNSSAAAQRIDWAEEERAEQERLEYRRGNRKRAPRSAHYIKGGVAAWEPTELGEQVWERFREEGARLPDVWTSSPPKS